MTMFWEVLNEAIREHTGDGNSRFWPYGYMMDEAGAFWASIAAVQGDEDFQRSVPCEKHFDFTVVRQEKTLVGEDAKSEFKFFCGSLQKAETPPVFQKASERMEEFIQTQPSSFVFELVAQAAKSCVSSIQASPQCPKDESCRDGTLPVGKDWGSESFLN